MRKILERTRRVIWIEEVQERFMDKKTQQKVHGQLQFEKVMLRYEASSNSLTLIFN